MNRNESTYPTDHNSFWRQVEILSEDECWLWTGCVGKEGMGYGRSCSRIRKRPTNAHIVAFEEVKGPVQKGLIVRHTCDTPTCCNPNHLILGTHQDNYDDMVLRNRIKSVGHEQRGVANNNVKYTEANVVDALILRKEFPTMTVVEISRISGLSYHMTARVLSGKSWTHIVI
jgi:hypothetical protein